MIVQEWEKIRAQAVADAMREVLTRGVEGAEVIYQQIAAGSLPSEVDAQARLAAYGMLAGLHIVEPWYVIPASAFENNWVSMGDALSNHAAVHIDPFGKIHWRGLVGRSSGVAVNGETICSFPAKYMPPKLQDYPCVSNAGVARIGVWNTHALGGQLVWRTTGGFTGGYGYIFLENIGQYDRRP